MKKACKGIRNGFFGKNKEGKILLEIMGLSTSELPFYVSDLKKEQHACWKDENGELVGISFKHCSEHIECFGIYRGKKKLIRVPYPDNCDETESKQHDDVDFLIGNTCMQCLYATIPDTIKEIYLDE